MKLRLDAFRGATQDVTIDFGKKKIIILYGENGCGKTTIVDAFDVLANGNEGSLSHKVGIGTKSRYLSSIQRDSKDLAIDLTIGTDTWETRKSGSKVSTSPDDSLPKVSLLRRQEITKLIEAGDTEKYNQIREFVEVPEVQANELELKDLVNRLKKDEKDLTAELGTVEQMIGMAWSDLNESEQAGTTVMEWAAQEAEAYNPDWKASENPARAICELSAALASHLTTLDRKISEQVEADEKASSAKKAFEKAAIDSASESADTLDILVQTKAYLEKRDSEDALESCPVCEQSLPGIALAERIPQRLASLQSVLKAKQAFDSAKVDASRAAAKVEEARSDVKDSFKSWNSERLEGDHGCDVPAPEPLEQWVENGEGEPGFAELAKTLTTFSDTLEVVMQSGGATHQRRKTLSQQMAQRADLRDSASENGKLLELAKGAYEIVQQARKDYVDSVLKEISGDVAAYYREIHPDENLEDIKMLLNPKQAGALQIKSSAFDQEDLIPQGFYSESHLDTLGICIFLALSRREGSEDTILIVDDAITSVDERHLERLVTLLYGQAEHFKRIILTSHYRPWKEKFRWGSLKESDCDLLELLEWKPETGIKSTRMHQLPVQRVRQLRDDENALPGEAVALAGVLLESLLDFLTMKYEFDIARKHPGAGWTLGEMLSAIKPKYRKLLFVEKVNADGEVEEKVELQEKFDDLENLFKLRNCLGCHFNDLGNHFSGGDANSFVDATLDLAEVLCDEAGALPRFDKTGVYWQTPDKSRRLYPLRKPLN